MRWFSVAPVFPPSSQWALRDLIIKPCSSTGGSQTMCRLNIHLSWLAWRRGERNIEGGWRGAFKQKVRKEGKNRKQVVPHGRLVIWGETEPNRGKQRMFGKRQKQRACMCVRRTRAHTKEAKIKNSLKSFWGEAARLHLSERAAHSVTCHNYPSAPWLSQP